MFKSQLLGSFCKQIVPLLTEHDDVIETQTKNCMRSQIAHATPLPHSLCNAWNALLPVFTWLRNCMRTKTNICLVYIFLREHCPDGSWTIFGRSRVDFLCTQLYYIWFDGVLDGGRWYIGFLQWIADSRYKKGWKHCSMQICCFKRKFILEWIMLKNT